MHEPKPSSRKKPYRDRVPAKLRTRSPRKLAGTKVARDIVKLHTHPRDTRSVAPAVYPVNHAAYEVDVIGLFGAVNPRLDKAGDRRLLMANEKVKRRARS
jgi:hypothetical protein